MTAKPIARSGYMPEKNLGPAATLPARPEGLLLRPAETALVIVDMQNAYASKGGYIDLAGFDVSGAPAVVEQIKLAKAAAKAAGIPVIYFQNGWDADYAEAGGEGSPNWYKSNALKTMRERPELWGSLLAKGGWDYAVIDDLVPGPGDLVVPKPRYSGFFNTNFDSLLRTKGIRNLVFTGVATNVCVESSIRDAFFLEYFSVVLEDAVLHAGPDFVRQASLFNIETFFGWVSSVADFAGTVAQVE